MDEREYVEREADLFEAGEYPDRGLTVTEEDLARLAATEAEVPIHVEHAGGVVKLGVVRGLQAAGRWLKGRLCLYPEANALLERLGVRGLSVAVARSLDRLYEVSVTGTPRVTGARMFSGANAEVVNFALGETPRGGQSMSEDPKGVSVEQIAALEARFAEVTAKQAELQATLTTERTAREAAEATAKAALEHAARAAFTLAVASATQRVDQAIEAGKLPPAVKDEAVALLLGTGTVRFADAEKPVAELFAAFLEKLPPRFGSKVSGQATTDPADGLTADQKAFFAKHFSDLKPEEIVKIGFAEKAEV